MFVEHDLCFAIFLERRRLAMKKFETPELEVQAFAVVDVITTSTDPSPN